MFLGLLERRLGLALLPDYWSSASTHLTWFVDGALLLFLVPWVGTDLLSLDRELYYGLYFVLSVGFVLLYAHVTGVQLTVVVTRHRTASVAAGMVAGFAAVAYVTAFAATPRPSGSRFVFELVWRGLALGMVNALVLATFPCLVARGVTGHIDRPWVRRAATGALSLVLVALLSACHHLGYRQFRDDDLWVAETAGLITSAPVVVTGNPLGSIVASTALTIEATRRSYETEVFIPPFEAVHPDYEPPGVFGGPR